MANAPMSSPMHHLKGSLSIDTLPSNTLQASPIQLGFGSTSTSGGGTPQIHGQPFMNTANTASMDSTRWNNPWTGTVLPQQSQQLHGGVEDLLQQSHQVSQPSYNRVSSHGGTPIHQPSLNSLIPPRGRASHATTLNTSSLDPNMFVGMNQGDGSQNAENREQRPQQKLPPPPPSLQQQQNSGGGRINLGWASGSGQGSTRNPASANLSPVVTVNAQAGGPHSAAPQPLNLSGPASAFSSRHGSPTARTGSMNVNVPWSDAQNPGAQLRQQRQSIGHTGLIGVMANNPTSGHPTPISSPLAKQQTLQPSNSMMMSSHQQLHPDINMMHAMGLNMMRNGQEAEFVRRHSGAGTLSHSSGSNTPHTFVAGPGGPLANLPGQYNMTVPGMGMAPRPHNMPAHQGFDGHFPHQFPFNGNQHGLGPSHGMQSPSNPLGFAFGQQNQGPMDFQSDMNQQGNFNSVFNSAMQPTPQGMITSHNLGMPYIRPSLSLPSTPLTSAKLLDSGFPLVGQGSGNPHQYQPLVQSSLANKVEYSMPLDAPVQPKSEPMDIDMTATGFASAVHSRHGSPLLEATGLENSPAGVKRSSSGTRKRDKDRPEPVYTFSGAQPVPSARTSIDDDGKLVAINVDSILDDNDQESQQAKIDHRKRKRNRTIQSCLPCHQNKRKCDRKKPCSRCKTLGLVSANASER
ncbi:hypothetical protein QFC22_004247 [Naganishia vaughanmartiniae]|uniref:Uncharacterized protein n=1 Tax=Naganishia vaughanmartiniae TaxID=1424756 RepID=A0ACC2X3H6_9TREE|nr:hypothetical protein QFC22_004247 [Naganishia vaughanmartiniae]